MSLQRWHGLGLGQYPTRVRPICHSCTRLIIDLVLVAEQFAITLDQASWLGNIVGKFSARPLYFPRLNVCRLTLRRMLIPSNCHPYTLLLCKIWDSTMRKSGNVYA